MDKILSIKREILSGLRSQRVRHTYCKNTGSIEIANVSLCFDPNFGYVKAHVRNHEGYFGSIDIEFINFESWFLKLQKFYKAFKRPSRILQDIIIIPVPSVVRNKKKAVERLIIPIPARLAHVIRA
jgi:hypothetical protein